MLEAEIAAGFRKGLGDVARTVIGHDAADGDAEAGIVGYRRRKEGDRTFLAFIGQDLAEGDARMIVDGDVDELPADASAIGLAGAITGDAVTDPLKSSELLDIDMDHLAGTIAFVAADGDRQSVASGRRLRPRARRMY